MRPALLALLLVACDTPPGNDAGARDAGPLEPVDAGSLDAGAPDAGPSDAGGDTPEPPATLTRWLTGDPADAIVMPRGPAVMIEGGGRDVDAAFAWQADKAAGGDVVVIRASGSDGYNDYLFTEIGGVDSVETLLLDRRALADEPYVAHQLDHAEAIFMAGGDQSVYLGAWRGTAVETSLRAAYARGAVVGGTSAGAAVLGELIFAAENGSITSGTALADPYGSRVTLQRDFLALPPLAGVLVDSHFVERDRMGRLLVFLARAIADGWSTSPVGLGLDVRTALLVEPGGEARVVGTGAAYLVTPDGSPATVTAGAPLDWPSVTVRTLRAGDRVQLPSGTSAATPRTLQVVAGALTPSDPY